MHNQKVKDYFNKIAPSYPSRFSNQKPFHKYFFEKRLQLALQNIDLNNKSILDIGAGTGSLYDFLKDLAPNNQYYACDISEEMLAQSNIRKNHRFVGPATKIQFPIPQFDLIFLLGVTSYFSNQEWQDHLEYISEKLPINGKAIISFTNKNTLDSFLRKCLSPFLKLFKKEENLLSQNFSTTPFSLKEVREDLSSHKLSLSNYSYFNFTYTPFNQLFPKTSIQLAEWLQNKSLSPTLQSFLAADFLVIIEKKN